MLKVLHIIPSIAPQSGGPAQAVVIYANLTAGFADTAILATNEFVEGQSAEEVRRRIGLSDAVALELFPYRGRHSTKYSSKLLARLDTLLPEYDAVHLHAAFSVMTTLSARKCRRYRVPYVFRTLGTISPYGLSAGNKFLKKLYYRFLETRSLAGAHCIHVTSPAEAEGVNQQAPGLPVVTIPIPVPLPEPSKLNPERETADRPLHIGFLSRLHPKKNLEAAFEALALTGDARSWHLSVAGSGDPDYERRLQRKADSLGIGEQITWSGFITGAEKHHFFQAIDIFLLPSRDENFGIAAAEAMAHGVPAVLSDAVDLASWAGEGSGVATCSTTSESIATALKQVASWTAAERKEYGRNARLLIEHHFDPEVIKEQLRELYTGMS